jgi:hypothetical protein
MVIHLFCDEADNDYFAFSVDVTGANIPPVTPLTEWIFLETIDTLKFPEQWDITDFQYVLDDLKSDGYFVSKGEFVDPLSLTGRPEQVPES